MRIALCNLTNQISYAERQRHRPGGMQAGTQQIAPMSRELNGTACGASASQLLIGLDGISIHHVETRSRDSVDQTPDTDDNCSDSINGWRQSARAWLYPRPTVARRPARTCSPTGET